MPSLNQQFMITVARERFDSLARQAPRKTSGTPMMPRPGTLARPPLATTTTMGSMLGSHAGTDYRSLIEPTCRALCAAHDLWRPQAHFESISINGPTAVGGTLEGPTLEPLIRTQLAALGQVPTQPALAAVAGGIGEAWDMFQRSFKVPGLPWYPSFAAFPGPMAPPTPNVPTPLVACTHDAGRVSAPTLKDAMGRRLHTTDADATHFFDAVATGFSMAVTQWLPAQPVTNVLGKGPVPTFAPPYVPVGPVVMGDNIATPGHLMS